MLKQRFGIGEPDEKLIETELSETMKLLGVLDQRLAGREWAAGDLSIADFALASTLTLRREAQIDLGGLPNVSAWIERLESRDSWRKAIEPMPH